MSNYTPDDDTDHERHMRGDERRSESYGDLAEQEPGADADEQAE